MQQPPQQQEQQQQQQQPAAPRDNGISVVTVEALWHFRGSSSEGVASVDFSPTYGDVGDASCMGRLATAGLDGVVRLWDLNCATEGLIQRAFRERTTHDYSFLEYVARLQRSETETVSCFTARWSPCGNFVVSTYSDSGIALWMRDDNATAQLQQRQAAQAGGAGGGRAGGRAGRTRSRGAGGADDDLGGDDLQDDDDAQAKERWQRLYLLRGPQHDVADVVDVAFTADCTHICIACASGAFQVIGIKDRNCHYMLPDAHPSCLGIAVDPFGLMLATTGSDARIRFYDTTQLIRTTNGGTLDWKDSEKRSSKVLAALQAGRSVIDIAGVPDAIIVQHGGPCFRRSSWSPDGAMAAFPYGREFKTGQTTVGADAAAAGGDAADAGDQQQQQQGAAGAGAASPSGPSGSGGVVSSVVLVLRHRPNRAAVALTVRETSVIRGCKFAPKVFEPFPEDVASADRCRAKGSWGPHLYRYALAMWTASTIVVYTSDCSARHSAFTNLHYAPINDVAWAPSCRLLVAGSEDQTVSMVSFADSLGPTVAFRVLVDRIPEAIDVPPLLTCAAELTKQLRSAAEQNEGAVLAKASPASRTVNRKVTATRRPRPAGDAKGAAAATAAAAGATTTDGAPNGLQKQGVAAAAAGGGARSSAPGANAADADAAIAKSDAPPAETNEDGQLKPPAPAATAEELGDV